MIFPFSIPWFNDTKECDTQHDDTQYNNTKLNVNKHNGTMYNQGILKRELLLYSWPPIWKLWNKLYDY